MGIPRLRRHLLPLCQPVLLQNGKSPEDEEIESIKSVVIDGPSLVYNVHSRLLSWFSATGCSVIDALPTCDEVSRGVMTYLLHLELLGVEIESIYFDGALPARKVKTRVARLEMQRSRLELFCAETKGGFEATNFSCHPRLIRPDNVLCSRPLPAKYNNVPANPFMVAAVFEDLKCRWNWVTVTSVTGDILHKRSYDPEAFPWASTTSMVPGEADLYCAKTANLKNSCILTNDSDLLLHDLGNHGSVIFLDSVELISWDHTQPFLSKVRAAMLRPSMALERLRISNLLPLAYHLKAHPEAGLVESLQQSRDVAPIMALPDYEQFTHEYRNVIPNISEQRLLPTFLDTRVSELFWQYGSPREYATGQYPHIYLPILIEDYTRRCAWDQGREYRGTAYSIMNLSRPLHEKQCDASEFLRRGQRIAEAKMRLYGEEEILVKTESLESLLGSLQADLGIGSDFSEFWAMFALRVIYGPDVHFSQSDIQSLEQFLSLGYMGSRLEWADIHLTAQINAVLYSLRILKQVLDLLDPKYTLAMRLKIFLRGLPPLHILSNITTRQRAASYASSDVSSLLRDVFGCSTRRERFKCPDCSVRKSQQESELSSGLADTGQKDGGNLVPSRIPNIYELLQEQ